MPIKTARNRALKVYKEAKRWAGKDPEFYLDPHGKLHLLNPKRPEMSLVILADVFGINSDETPGRVQFKEEDFQEEKLCS